MFKGSVSRIVGVAVLFGAVSSLPHAARAQVYKCPQPGGGVAFQGSPCPSNAKPPAPPKAGTFSPLPAAAARSNDDPYAQAPNSEQRWTIPAAPVRNEPRAPAPTAVVRGERPAAVQEPPVRRAADAERDLAFQQMKVESERAAAFNKMQRCNYARQQLGVANSGRPILSYNNKGEAQYVDDKDRQAVTATKQQRVAEECN